MFILVYKVKGYTLIILNSSELCWKWCREYKYLYVSGLKNIMQSVDVYSFSFKEKRFVKQLLEKYGTKS